MDRRQRVSESGSGRPALAAPGSPCADGHRRTRDPSRTRVRAGALACRVRSDDCAQAYPDGDATGAPGCRALATPCLARLDRPRGPDRARGAAGSLHAWPRVGGRARMTRRCAVAPRSVTHDSALLQSPRRPGRSREHAHTLGVWWRPSRQPRRRSRPGDGSRAYPRPRCCRDARGAPGPVRPASIHGAAVAGRTAPVSWKVWDFRPATSASWAGHATSAEQKNHRALIFS